MPFERAKNPYNPFSREWFAHVWAYQKLLILLFLLGCFGVVMNYMATDNDIEIRFVGPELKAEQAKALKSDFFKLTKDTNGDKRKHLHFVIKTLEDNYKMNPKKGKATVQILPKPLVAIYFNENKNVFMDMSELAKEYNIPEDRLMVLNGKTCAIQLGGTKIFKEKNIFTPDLYLVVRSKLPKEENNKKWIASYENGIEVARYLLDND